MDRTSTRTISRRTFVKVSTATGIMLAGIGGASAFGTPAAFAQNGDSQAVCNSNNVNIRANYGLSGRIIGTLNSGDIVNLIGGPVDADGYSWFNVNVAGTGLNGWVAGAFLDQGGQPGGGGFPQGAWIMTTTGLNLRSGPGTSYGVIATYRSGQAATVISGPQSAGGYSWYKVEMANDHNVGWFAGEFLDYAPTEPTGTIIRVADGPLNVRSTPSLSGKILMTADTGATGRVTDASLVRADGYLWVSVQWFNQAGTIGWVASDFIEWT